MIRVPPGEGGGLVWIIIIHDLAVWWHGFDAVIHLAAEGVDALEEIGSIATSIGPHTVKKKTGRLSVIRSTSLSAICNQEKS